MLAAVCVASVAMASPAAKTPETVKDARRAFESEWGASFGPKKALPARFCASDAEAFGADEAEWRCVLPLDDGDRLRFLCVTLRGGAFVRGTLHYFGIAPMTLTAAEYQQLRRDFPLAAVPAAASAPEQVRLLAPTSRTLAKPIPPKMATSLRIDPFGELFGRFADVLAHRLRVKTDGIAFRVVHVDAMGARLEIGTVRNVREARELKDRQVLDAVGTAFPNRVSDRARTDWFLVGTLLYESVVPESAAK